LLDTCRDADRKKQQKAGALKLEQIKITRSPATSTTLNMTYDRWRLPFDASQDHAGTADKPNVNRLEPMIDA